MHFKTRVMLAVGCVSLIALSIPAFSRPLPNNGEMQTRAQTARVAPSKPIPQQKPNAPVQRANVQRNAPILAAASAQHPEIKKPLFGWPALVAEARRYMGTNPTARTKLWCATFMNMVLAKAGYSGTNSDAAKSFASYGRRISEPRIGAIAVLTRGKNGGHVGVVSGIDKQGNPIIISGNSGHDRRVREGVYPRSRVIAYVMPTDNGRPTTIQVADRGPPNVSRAGSEPSIDSPIAELIAAIQAEGRPERPGAPAAQAQPQPPVQTAALVQPAPPAERVVEQLSAAPRRIVQQMPEAPQQQRVWRQVPLNSALADLFGSNRR